MIGSLGRLPALVAAEAASALEHAREALAGGMASGPTPAFTARVGGSDFSAADGIEESLRLADTALFQAKRQGRNRVVIDPTATPQPAAA